MVSHASTNFSTVFRNDTLLIIILPTLPFGLFVVTIIIVCFV